MRVITGTCRGRRLLEPVGRDVRPTADQVKEAMFSIVQFDLPGARVLDLYAGSGQLGIEALSTNILGSKQLAIYGILFVSVWQGLAMPTVLFLAGLQTIPTDLYESAMIDGANSWQRFKFITMPFLIPVITVVLILSVKGGLGIFDLIVALTDGGPARTTESVSYLVYADAFKNNKFSFAIAESVVVGMILALISVVQIIFQNKKKVNR